MNKTIPFNKATIDQLTTQNNSNRTYFRDKNTSGLSLAVHASGVKSFYVVKKINGQTAKIFLGKYPELSVENARKLAKIKLGQIALGINPQAEKQRIRAEMTFGDLFEQYMTRYSKPHKKTWKSDQYDIHRFCGHWFKKRISEIKRADVQRLHEMTYADNGLFMANAILRRVRAVYNKAIEWGWEGSNPSKGIKKYRQNSRDRFIQPSELPFLIKSINEENDGMKDFLWMLLLTGARKTNTLNMRWEQISWERSEWRIPDTKNGEPVTIPLSEQAMDILRLRLKSVHSPYVFPHDRDINKPLGNLVARWQIVKERATLYLIKQADTQQEHSIGLNDLRMHDLRRTFASYQALSGASLQIIGKSLGHKSIQATQVYARLNIDAVRASIVKGTDLMLATQNRN